MRWVLFFLLYASVLMGFAYMLGLGRVEDPYVGGSIGIGVGIFSLIAAFITDEYLEYR